MATVLAETAREYPDLVGPVIEKTRTRIRNYPAKSNRASEAGHPCERYLVLSRTNWQDKALYEPTLEFIFEGGRMIETMALRQLETAGFQVVEQQRAFEWPALELTGHLDAKVVISGKAYPLEVKGLNHQDYERLNTMADFLNSTKPWIRKYPAQLMMYMLNTESELGCFYLISKTTFEPKTVWLELDYAYTESICQKLERVNAHVRAGTRPEPTDEYELCQKCAFLHVCLPEIKGHELELADDPELEQKLLRREELAAVAKEYERLDKELKEVFQGREKVSIGDFLVTSKKVPRKSYTVAESAYWLTKITRLA